MTKSLRIKIDAFAASVVSDLDECGEAHAQEVIDAVMLGALSLVEDCVRGYWTHEQIAYALAQALGESIAMSVQAHIEDPDEEIEDSYAAFEEIAEHCYALFRKEFQKVEP